MESPEAVGPDLAIPLSRRRKLVDQRRGRPLMRGEFRHVSTINSEPSAIDREQGAESLGEIISRFNRTGRLVASVDPREGRFGDFSSAGDFQTQMERVTDAIMEFQELPARIREYFDHDPVRLAEFLDDPSKIAEGREIGLYAPEADPPISPPDPGSERAPRPAEEPHEGRSSPATSTEGGPQAD